jgi:hypothetical protein
MDLGELSIACLFGSRQPPAHYQVGLQWRGTELAVGGYKRVTVGRDEWQSAGTVASANVHFDGFGGPANIDAIVVYLPDGTALPPLPLDGDLHLGMADTAIDLEATVDMTPRPLA